MHTSSRPRVPELPMRAHSPFAYLSQADKIGQRTDLHQADPKPRHLAFDAISESAACHYQTHVLTTDVQDAKLHRSSCETDPWHIHWQRPQNILSHSWQTLPEIISNIPTPIDMREPSPSLSLGLVESHRCQSRMEDYHVSVKDHTNMGP